MKKVFSIHKLEDIQKNPLLKKSLILAYRQAVASETDPDAVESILHLQNIDCSDPSKMKIEYDDTEGRVILSFILKRNEFLSLGDDQGICEKRVLKSIK